MLDPALNLNLPLIPQSILLLSPADIDTVPPVPLLPELDDIAADDPALPLLPQDMLMPLSDVVLFPN